MLILARARARDKLIYIFGGNMKKIDFEKMMKKNTSYEELNKIIRKYIRGDLYLTNKQLGIVIDKKNGVNKK